MLQRKLLRTVLAVSLILAVLSTSTVSSIAISHSHETLTTASKNVQAYSGAEQVAYEEPMVQSLEGLENIRQPEFVFNEKKPAEEEPSETNLVQADVEGESFVSTLEPAEEVITEEPVLEKEEDKNPERNLFSSKIDPNVTYSAEKLTLSNIPAALLNNAGIDLNSKDAPVELDTSDATELNSFTTVNGDGTNTLYLFSQPVKYVDNETREIRFIDNTILPVENTAILLGTPQLAGYKNASNLIDVRMPANVADGISMQVDDISVKLYPAALTDFTLEACSQASLVNANNLGSSETVVEYANALGSGIHLQYVPVNMGIKENIVLDAYTGVNTFGFIIETGKHIPLYTEGEAIPFIDPETDEIVFIIGQIDARDSYVGEATDGHFTLNNSLALEEIKEGIYALTVTVDAAFLADPDTVYPVIIDPSITIASGGMLDTTVYSGYPERQTYYSSAYNIVGHYSSTAGYGTALIQTTTLDNYNFASGDIISANYSVYEGSGSTATVHVQLKAVLDFWNQTSVTYSDLRLGHYVSGLSINSSGWKNFDVTTLLKRMKAPTDGLQDIWEDCGFALTYYGTPTSGKHFCSANHASYAPSLSVTYQNTATNYIFDVDAIYNCDANNTTYFKAIGYTIDGYSPEFKILITKTGEHVFSTLNSESYFGDNHIVNTKIELFNSNHTSLKYVTGSNLTYNITTTGTYYVRVYNSSGTRSNVKCYFIAEKRGELSEAYSVYSKSYRDFYKVAKATTVYNCLAYVKRRWNEKIGLPAGEAQAKALFANDGAAELPIKEGQCIVLYKQGSYVTHVALVEDGTVKAKLGDLERVRHTSIDSYFEYSYDDEDRGYGAPYYFFEDIYATD